MIYPEDVAKLGRGSKWHRSQPSSLHLKSSRVPLGVTVTPVVGPAALAQGRDNPILTDCYSMVLSICMLGNTGGSACPTVPSSLLPSLALKGLPSREEQESKDG